MVRGLQREGDDLVDSVNTTISLANSVLMDIEYYGEGYSAEDEVNQSAEHSMAATDTTTKHWEHAVAISATSQSVRNTQTPAQSGPGGELNRKVNKVSHKINDTANYSPPDNAEKTEVKDNKHMMPSTPVVRQVSTSLAPHNQPVNPN